jgi:hypothetical protein
MKQILAVLAALAFTAGLFGQTVTVSSKSIEVVNSTGRTIHPVGQYTLSLKVSPDTSLTITRAGGPYKPIASNLALSAVTLGVNDTTAAQKITAIQALGATFQVSAAYRTIIPKSDLWAFDYATAGKRVDVYFIDGRKLLRTFTTHIDSLKNDSSTTARLVYLRSTFYP